MNSSNILYSLYYVQFINAFMCRLYLAVVVFGFYVYSYYLNTQDISVNLLTDSVIQYFCFLYSHLNFFFHICQILHISRNNCSQFIVCFFSL